MKNHLSRLAAKSLALLLLFSLASPPPVNAQDTKKGTLQGRILDAETDELLPFATVIFFKITRDEPTGEAAGGAYGTGEGTYSAKLAPGSYRVEFHYIGYDKLEINGVFVPGDETITVDGVMTPQKNQVETFEVRGEAIRNAQGSIIARMKEEGAVNEAITADLISRTGDSNAAQALERVTGVSVVGDKYVFVRGMGERYSSTTVNGAAVGSPETNKRVVPLDLFPSGVLDNIIVQKTFSPDMDGDFGGGVVQVNTRDFISGHSFKQSLSFGYVEDGTDEGFLSYEGGSRDWLGYDDGTRELPQLVRDAESRIDRFQYTKEERQAMVEAFSNTWTPRAESGPPAYSYSGVYSRGLKLFGMEAGLLASGGIGSKANSVSKVENTYFSGEPSTLYDVNQSKHDVSSSLTGSLSLRLSEEKNDFIKANLLYTRSATDLVKVSEGVNNDIGVDLARVTDIAYLERGVSQSVLQGEHSGLFYGSLFEWNLGYSEARKNEPDRRRYTYQQDFNSGELVLGGRSTHPLQRVFGSGHEYTRSAKLDWTMPLVGESESPTSKLQFGYLRSYKNRDSEYRRFGFTCQRGGNCSIDRTLSPEEIMFDSTGTPNYVIEELTRDNDSWVGNHGVTASYMMLDTRPTGWLRIVTGARYEDSTQDVLARAPFAVNGASENISNKDSQWLPAVNVTLSSSSKTQVRLAASRTINRPEIRELVPFRYYNFEKAWEEEGNADLESATLKNYDLRYEYYPYPGDFIGVGGFYKDFDRPIQKVLDTQAAGFKEIPINGLSGFLAGWEAEVRLSGPTMWKLMDWLIDLNGEEAPESMLRWGMMANYSRISSEAEYVLSETNFKRPFTGQSEFSLNLGVFYRTDRWESNLVYKTFGDRLALFGLGTQDDLYETPPKDLDLSFAYDLSGSAKVKLSASNLLNEESVFAQGDLLTQSYRRGRTLGLAISYSPTFGVEE